MSKIRITAFILLLTGLFVIPSLALAADEKPVTSCSDTSYFTGDWFTYCMWIPMLGWLGSWFLTMGGAILLIAGWLFDFLVMHGLINFQGTLSSLGILDAIETGWTVFRDLANIAIIGMFTFIAIGTILGSTDYGAKKLLSRVLIIAILINFSLLFCKLIIDASNFTAYQFYSAAAASASIDPGQFDMAKAFLKP